MARRPLALVTALLLAATLVACSGDDDEGEVGDACDDFTDCDLTLYCQTPVGDCDGVGTCAETPEDCPLIVLPACGCDGVTYSNSCVAAAAGVSVRSDGACP